MATETSIRVLIALRQIARCVESGDPEIATALAAATDHVERNTADTHAAVLESLDTLKRWSGVGGATRAALWAAIHAAHAANNARQCNEDLADVETMLGDATLAAAS